MLANSFMTPTALGISDTETATLIHLLGMLDRGEFGENEFDMSALWPCASGKCICGWAHAISGGRAFPEADPKDIEAAKKFDLRPEPLKTLFMMDRPFFVIPKVSPPQAAVALRNYLTTGEARWHEAITAG